MRKQRRRLFPVLGTSAVVAGFLLVGVVGCSMSDSGVTGKGKGSEGEQSDAESRLGYRPEVRDPLSAEEEVNRISDRVRGWMGLKSKVTDMEAAAGSCEAVDPDYTKYYVVNHPWSVHNVEEGSLAQAMQNLRERLPRHGWKITKDGKMNSKAGDPEIVAVEPRTHHFLTVQWRRGLPGKVSELISVDVDSRCYRAPKGTDFPPR